MFSAHPIKRAVFIVIITIQLSFVHRGTCQTNETKNLLINGDLTQGTLKWSGNLKLETLDGNKCLSLNAFKNTEDKLQLTQTFRSVAAKALEVTFRYKTDPDYKLGSEYKGEGIRMRIYEQSDIDDEPDKVWNNHEVYIKKPTDWKHFSWVLKAPPAGKKFYFEVSTKNGTPKIYFDDFCISPSDSSPTPD